MVQVHQQTSFIKACQGACDGVCTLTCQLCTNARYDPVQQPWSPKQQAYSCRLWCLWVQSQKIFWKSIWNSSTVIAMWVPAASESNPVVDYGGSSVDVFEHVPLRLSLDLDLGMTAQDGCIIMECCWRSLNYMQCCPQRANQCGGKPPFIP